jgi:hypothetical protein
MALKAILTSLDGIDSGLHGLYRQDGERFVLDVEPSEGWALEDVHGLKNALQSERARARQFEQISRKFDGLDPDTARDALQAVADGVVGGLDDKKFKEKIEAREKQIAEKFQLDLNAAKERTGKLQSELETQLIHNATVEALRKHGGNVDLLLPHVKAQTRLEETENGWRVVVAGENGEARVSMKAGSVENMTIDELVGGLRQQDSFAPAFSGSGATGSGASGSTVGSRGGGGAPIRLSYADSKSPARYQQAKAAAAKAGVALEIEQHPSHQS